MNKSVFNCLVILQKVGRQSVEEFPKTFNSDWNLLVCTEFLYHFLEQIKHKLSLLPERTFLLAERQPASKEFKFSIMNAFEMDAIKFFGKEFVVKFLWINDCYFCLQE